MVTSRNIAHKQQPVKVDTNLSVPSVRFNPVLGTRTKYLNMQDDSSPMALCLNDQERDFGKIGPSK